MTSDQMKTKLCFIAVLLKELSDFKKNQQRIHNDHVIKLRQKDTGWNNENYSIPDWLRRRMWELHGELV